MRESVKGTALTPGTCGNVRLACHIETSAVYNTFTAVLVLYGNKNGMKKVEFHTSGFTAQIQLRIRFYPWSFEKLPALKLGQNRNEEDTPAGNILQVLSLLSTILTYTECVKRFLTEQQASRARRKIENFYLFLILTVHPSRENNFMIPIYP